MMGAAGAAGEKVYVEDVFSTYLYTGNDSPQTITNGIDLAGEGGLVWLKNRSVTSSHRLVDTVRGALSTLFSESTSAAVSRTAPAADVDSFTSTGFVAGYFGSTGGDNWASWTFRKQPKFFDVVTWTGSNDSGTNIGKGIVSHNLGSAPGCVIVKNATSGSANWIVYHRSLSGGYRVLLNTTDAETNTGSVGYFSKYTDGVGWAQTNPDANNIYVGYNYQTNDNGATMVAYLFAHDAGGFGDAGTDNVISCGSFTTNSSGVAVVDLGYEPQWVLVRPISGASNTDWRVMDNMRGITVDNANAVLRPNSSAAEFTSGTFKYSINGFTSDGLVNSTECIYIAIRRGPMKTPESGTEVFDVDLQTGGGFVTTNFPVDLTINARPSATTNRYASARLTSGTEFLVPNLSNAATTGSYVYFAFDKNNGIKDDNWGSGSNSVYWNFRRAPGFFDVVCYTGTGSARTVAHNLGVAPELMIVKSRSLAQGGAVYTASTGNANFLRLFSTSSDSGETPTSFWNSTTPTASVFSLGTANNVNGNTDTYVAYLFATCAGVSKVGSYTGTGSTQTINCGFTGGARFVLIKKSTSFAPDRDWYVWDTARGMVSGTDPSLKLNTTAAEVNANDVYTITTGFQLVSISDYVNASGVTYIFYAIA
jgi:hypothetical protein